MQESALLGCAGMHASADGTAELRHRVTRAWCMLEKNMEKATLEVFFCFFAMIDLGGLLLYRLPPHAQWT